MTNIRLLPVVVLAIAALLVFKTIGLVTNGGYVLGGVRQAVASGAAPAGGGEGASAEGGDATMTMPSEPTIEDTTPTLADPSPTLKPAAEGGGGHGAPTAEEHSTEPAADAGEGHADTSIGAAATTALRAATANGTYCVEADATINDDGTVVMNGASAEGEAGGHGGGEAAPAAEGDAAHGGDEAAAADGHGGTETAAADDGHGGTEAASGDHAADAAATGDFASAMTDCLPSGDAIPLQIDGSGGSIPLVSTDGASATEKALLERLAARRLELQKYEDDLALRSQIVDAAEKRIEERAATLQALESQISTLVDQRKEMESGQFAGIVAMYETMKPKDAANIFNNLDMDVLLRVAKTMSPRKMAPILAVMDTQRAQELTVKMAALADTPADQMTPQDLAALPQIVGQ
ncbi:MotE family protein [Devosia aquimaris]|uniref:MotE family protein n=1 Tax=Devosia aquimaris TaxID=2866214 RepID=UPI001CD12893|nr:MotE family protein [Devosia sp. CJK-A8-3]